MARPMPTRYILSVNAHGASFQQIMWAATARAARAASSGALHANSADDHDESDENVYVPSGFNAAASKHFHASDQNVPRGTEGSGISAGAATGDDDDDDDVADDDEEGEYADAYVAGHDLQIGGADPSIEFDNVQSLTVQQLKQQLRLRGLKVSGRKQDLIQRLLNSSSSSSSSNIRASNASRESEDEDENEDDVSSVTELLTTTESAHRTKKASSFMKRGKDKEFIDVTPYLDDQDVGKSFRSIGDTNGVVDDATPDDDVVDNNSTDSDHFVGADDPNEASSNPETWGSSAKIVDDFEGRDPIVDGLSRTVIEFLGSNKTSVSAFVVASRDALRPFLEGGQNRTINAGDPEERLREIQEKREQASKRPIRFEDTSGLDEGDETGIYKDILHREFSDWGKYTLTGAQLSAQEVKGVLLLSDVYGAFSEDTRVLAEKIAFECQPVVVMVPDLFRGNPWKEDATNPGLNENGQDYEEWRKQHSDVRVNVDIRASAYTLREQYGVSSVAVFGTCFGGGRALEVAAGYYPNDQLHDIDGSIGPPLVSPGVAIAWYPTRYDARLLFGKDRKVEKESLGSGDASHSMAVMAVFAGNDKLPGATPEDAALLKEVLQEDNRVKDLMVKIFPNQDHGFAHMGLSSAKHADDGDEFEQFVDEEFGGSGRIGTNDGEAEVACLLSTAFMETYGRVFLPTIGPPISKDEAETGWSQQLGMKNLEECNTRDVRQEIKESLEGFVEEPLGGRMIDPNDETQQDELAQLLRSMEPDDYNGPFKIEDDDDLETIYAKLKAADPTFQLF
eukprot:CAMPEP_0119552702 /NCGR_PEP_ID=MMETSP1352-20130426/5624_1 /TAXON_ID=265584 /ORGANISM="Stauroneis constricta, Strain CCMP1120" /LENGTH=791 /DNA_ID=CAMNT_0007598973 /DNA_START=136 /DNA_END=2512 /DNA_ORIENTATION=-